MKFYHFTNEHGVRGVAGFLGILEGVRLNQEYTLRGSQLIEFDDVIDSTFVRNGVIRMLELHTIAADGHDWHIDQMFNTDRLAIINQILTDEHWMFIISQYPGMIANYYGNNEMVETVARISA